MDNANDRRNSLGNTDNPSGFGKCGNVSLRFSPVSPSAAQWVLLIQLENSADYTVNQVPVTLHKADACLLRPTDTLRCGSKVTPTCLSFLVDADYIRSLSSLLDVNLYPDLSQDQALLRFSLSASLLASTEQKASVIQMSSQHSSEYSRSCMLLFQELYVQFLTQHLYTPPQYPEWLSRLIVTLHDSSRFGVPLSQLAATTPYSYSRLTRVFKHYTGVSLIDYVTDIKLRYAKQLLRSTDMTMLAIASNLEFSVSYFNKLFKKKVGITPGEYRRNHQ